MKSNAVQFVNVILVSLILLFFSAAFFNYIEDNWLQGDTESVQVVIEGQYQQGLFGVAYVIGLATLEEVIFRGIIYSIGGPIWSIVLFGLAHLGYNSILEFAWALVGGGIFLWARIKSKSLLPPIIIHCIYNLMVIFVFYPMKP